MQGRVILKDTLRLNHPTKREHIPSEIESVDRNAEQESSSFKFDINLFELVRLLVHKRRLIVSVVCAVMVITAGYTFLKPNMYTSKASILPSGKSMNDGLNSVKSLVGLADPLALSDEHSSALFPVILKSNLIVNAVLEKTYVFSDGERQQSQTLGQYFDEENPDLLRRNLRDQTTIESDKRTGEISVGVETSSPHLSQLVVAEYLTQLEDYNLNKRRSSAKNNAQFLSHQTELVGRELRGAEDQLEQFQNQNMDWNNTSSPETLKELSRLQRDVEIKSNTYTTLCHQYESAKLDAQKDVPIVRILDTPSLPTIKSGPFRRQVIILSGLLAFMIVSLAIIGSDIARQGTSGGNRADFESLRDTVQNAFPRGWRMVDRIRTMRRPRLPAVESTQK